MDQTQRDIWYSWLLDRRFGGNADLMKVAMERLHKIRGNVLENAKLGEGETLLDVGCGDGLIAFGALEKVPMSKVIFSDISQDLLTHVQSLVEEMGVADRCQFLLASADDLTAIPDTSVDVVTTRSVLIYVSAKQESFNEFFRVLKPNGRLSIFEPINRFASCETDNLFWGYDATPVVAIADKLKALYNRLQPADSDPMLNFDERDLIAFAEKAGFAEIHLELQADIAPDHDDHGWNAFLHVAGNPKIPNLAEAMAQVLTPTEQETFVRYLRPLVEAHRGVSRMALAYMWAIKG